MRAALLRRNRCYISRQAALGTSKQQNGDSGRFGERWKDFRRRVSERMDASHSQNARALDILHAAALDESKGSGAS